MIIQSEGLRYDPRLLVVDYMGWFTRSVGATGGQRQGLGYRCKILWNGVQGLQVVGSKMWNVRVR